MDGRTFDDLTRSFAQRTNRRRLLKRGAAAAAAAAGLTQLSPVDAARRGKPPTTAICIPDGNGGFSSATVNNILLSSHLAAGAVLDNGCCSSAECSDTAVCAQPICDTQSGTCILTPLPDDTECIPDGSINYCRTPYTCQSGVCSEGIGIVCADIAGGCQESLGCDPATGTCMYGPKPNGSSCLRGQGCANGSCLDGVCLDPEPLDCRSDACRICGYDACTHVCSCLSVGCGVDDPECQTAACDSELGCVYMNINENGACSRGAQQGQCVEGVCVIVF